MFTIGIRKYIKEIGQGFVPSNGCLQQIYKGWNNPWSARPHFIKACLTESLNSSGTILECGSGLTTILVGILMQKYNRSVISLEHNCEYAEKINQILIKWKISSVKLKVAPLKSYDKFDWYDTSNITLPNDISLVICDGPPGNTRGGRYGLLPLITNHLSKECTIILDDARRPSEQEIAQQWVSQYKMTALLAGPKDDPFFILRRNE